MIAGVSFDNMHCQEDLGMLLASKDIGLPEVQSNFVEVPGRNGALDFTEALTGDVRYNSRTITLSFVTSKKVSHQDWATFLATVEDALHGYRKKIIFDDDAGHYYSGRCQIDQFTTSWPKQTINVTCTCDPFKQEVEYSYYFAVYCATDGSLTFYGDNSLPSGTYKGKAVTTVYDGAAKTSTSTNSIPWYGDRTLFKSVTIHPSFAAAKPTRLYYYFYGFTNCEKISGLSNINTESVTNMYGMFYNCSLLMSIDVSTFNTSKVTTMYCMFYGCSSLTHLDVSGFDTSSVTTIYGMFRSCSALDSLSAAGLNTEKVTNMSYTFYGCSALERLDLSGWSTAAVTNMSYMFRGCTALKEIDVSKFDTAKLTNMGYMFYLCSELTTIYSNDDVFVTTAVTSGSAVFTNCTNLVGGNGTTYSSSNTSYTYARVDTANNPGYFTQR